MIRFLRLGWIAVLLALTANAVYADLSVPPLKSRVTQLTVLLTPSQQQGLEDTLRDFEARKGSQIAVLIVSTLARRPSSSTPYASPSNGSSGAKEWTTGCLLLIAKDDRTVRIEVGYGLEGVMPDAVANRVIDGHHRAAFSSRRLLRRYTSRCPSDHGLIDGEPLPPPKPGRHPQSGSSPTRPCSSSDSSSWW